MRALKSACDSLGWGTDGLTSYIQAAHENALKCFCDPRTRAGVQRLTLVDSLFGAVLAVHVNVMSSDIAAAMLLNAAAAFKATAQLAMETKKNECYVMMRNCVEYTLYAIHMHGNPNRVKIWSERDIDDAHKKLVTKNFSPTNMFSELKEINQPLGIRLDQFYSLSISSGAHPNHAGLVDRYVDWDKPTGGIEAKVLMMGNGEIVPALLADVAGCGLTVLECLKIIYPERFVGEIGARLIELRSQETI